jgi:hypothetical protein
MRECMVLAVADNVLENFHWDYSKPDTRARIVVLPAS